MTNAIQLFTMVSITAAYSALHFVLIVTVFATLRSLHFNGFKQYTMYLGRWNISQKLQQ